MVSFATKILVLVALCDALIFRVTHSHMSKSLDHIESFWFEPFPACNFTLVVKNFIAYGADGKADPRPRAPVGFALEGRERVMHARMDKHYFSEDRCFVDWTKDRFSMVLPWKDLRIITVDPSKRILLRSNTTSTDPQIIDLSPKLNQAGLYSLFFFNCNPDYTYSYDIEFHEYNIDAGGNKMYLQKGDQPLPKLFFIFAVFQLGLLTVWAWRVRRPVGVLKVHLVMGAILALSSASSFFGALHYYWVNRNGNSLGLMSYEYYGSRAGWCIVTLVTVTWIGLGSPTEFKPLTPCAKLLLFFVGAIAAIASLGWTVAVSQSEGHPYWDLARVANRIAVSVAQLLSVLPYLFALYARNPSKQLAAACGYCWCAPCTAVALLFGRWKEIQLRKLLLLCATVMMYYFLLSVLSVVKSQLHPTATWYGNLINAIVLFGWYLAMGFLMWPESRDPAVHEIPQPARPKPGTHATANFTNFFEGGADEEDQSSDEDDDATGNKPLIRGRPTEPSGQRPIADPPADSVKINLDNLLPDLSEGEEGMPKGLSHAMQPIDML
eukprot:TRINITY_DN67577_c0_g1_i1.p1 TRINITY_DN67577_c0_g1~~TRINITY_DN67577_c0_g1_i1.p1  ORF type:complete len:561 (+),score=80.34 TRINITY_DN67577_c0_g1_i1:31-1683(+)